MASRLPRTADLMTVRRGGDHIFEAGVTVGLVRPSAVLCPPDKSGGYDWLPTAGHQGGPAHCVTGQRSDAVRAVESQAVTRDTTSGCAAATSRVSEGSVSMS